MTLAETYNLTIISRTVSTKTQCNKHYKSRLNARTHKVDTECIYFMNLKL